MTIGHEEVFCKKNVHSAHRVIVPLAGKEADRAILAKNSVRIYTILCSKAWLYSERMKKKNAKKERNHCILLQKGEKFAVIDKFMADFGAEKAKK